MEGWTLLAALAASTERIRLGALVTGVTYRQPALLAAEAVTVDHVSNGRLEFGLGAAWFAGEHEQLGFDFPGAGVRIIFNYSEALLDVPPDVAVHTSNPAVELLHALYFHLT